MSDETRRLNEGQTFSVYYDAEAVHLVIKDRHGRTMHFPISADCADNIAGALHQASRRVQWGVIAARGAVGGARL